jgi:long-subunit fatty acid transport protein
MKLNVYSIYDSGIEAYAQPFLMQTDGQAIRAFQDNVNDEKSTIYNHADQFTLFKIAEYDDQTGKMENIENKSLGVGLQYKNTDTIQGDIAQEILELLKEIREEK